MSCRNRHVPACQAHRSRRGGGKGNRARPVAGSHHTAGKPRGPPAVSDLRGMPCDSGGRRNRQLKHHTSARHRRYGNPPLTESLRGLFTEGTTGCRIDIPSYNGRKTSCPAASCKGHGFPAEIIAHAAWLSFRSLLSYRQVEEILAAAALKSATKRLANGPASSAKLPLLSSSAATSRSALRFFCEVVKRCRYVL